MTVSGFPEKRSLYFGSAEEKQDGRSKMDERARWNQAADHFQKIVDEKDEGYTNRLIEFLCEQGALKRGIRVADTGCGAGKYAVHFAKRGCSLLLVDFSENMMAYTKKSFFVWDRDRGKGMRLVGCGYREKRLEEICGSGVCIYDAGSIYRGRHI